MQALICFFFVVFVCFVLFRLCFVLYFCFLIFSVMFCFLFLFCFVFLFSFDLSVWFCLVFFSSFLCDSKKDHWRFLTREKNDCAILLVSSRQPKLFSDDCTKHKTFRKPAKHYTKRKTTLLKSYNTPPYSMNNWKLQTYWILLTTIALHRIHCCRAYQKLWTQKMLRT